jgi:hypothetical protein
MLGGALCRREPAAAAAQDQQIELPHVRFLSPLASRAESPALARRLDFAAALTLE